MAGDGEPPRDEKPTEKFHPDDQPTLPRLVSRRRVFDRYVLEVVAGKGGMGVVWRARDEKLERTVALKFLPPEVAADPEAIRDLKRETKRSLDLTHPHIVRVYDMMEFGTDAAIAMEFVDGESLAKRKAASPDGCLSVTDLAPLVAQLCSALDYAHREAKIVHRDLKPANLLVTGDGRLKVTDFGIARSLSETRTRLTGTVGGTSGTLLYMSPQQVLNQPHTPADDLYSLGATLYELLSGKPPFYGGDLFNLIQQVAPIPPTARRTELGLTGEPIPRVWEETILACLAKNPKDRPQSAGEVAARLGLAIKSAQDAKDEVGAEVPSRPTVVRKSPKLLYAGLAAAVALTVAAILFWPTKGSKTVGPALVAEPREQSPVSQTGLPASGSPTSPAAALARLPAEALAKAGEFTITVDPSDAAARLWLGPLSDVAVTGGHAVLKDLPDGEQDLIVQAPGYQPYTTRVIVKDGRGRADARLVPVRGAVEVTARPGTVVTALDARGKAIRLGTVPAAGSLLVDSLLNVGSYTLRFEHPDLAPVEQKDVELVIGRTLKVAPVQTPLPGELRVFSVPSGAEVRVNGTVVGTTPATLKGQPSEQPLAVTVFQRGYRRTEQSVTLKPKEIRTLNVGTLAAESGGINLRIANPAFPLAQATVTIDGKPTEVGRGVPSAPLSLDGLEIGARTVALTHPDYEPWSQTVTVRDQQATTVDVRLTPKPGRLSLRVNGPEKISFFVNGESVGGERFKDGTVELPAQQELDLAIKAPGWKSATRRLTLPANGTETWSAVMEKQPFPTAGQPFENTLGQKFVPVPGTSVLFCIWETRVQDFEAFVNATGYDATQGMYSFRNGNWGQNGDTWKSPGFPQGATHPVVGVNDADAKAFCAWLTDKERREGRLAPDQEYRLPTDAEWDAAVGTDQFPWGDQWPPPNGAGNYADESAKRGRYSGWTIISGYDDGYESTAPVGSFSANRYGIYDLGGNVWERVGDRAAGVRGASFDVNGRDYLASANRGARDDRVSDVGFRVVCAVGSAR